MSRIKLDDRFRILGFGNREFRVIDYDIRRDYVVLESYDDDRIRRTADPRSGVLIPILTQSEWDRVQMTHEQPDGDILVIAPDKPRADQNP